MPLPLPRGSTRGCRGLLLIFRLSGTLCFPRRHQNAQGCLLASPKNLVLMVLHSWEGSKIRQPLAQPRAELRPGRTRELGRISPDPSLGPHGCARRALQGPPAFHCQKQSVRELKLPGHLQRSLLHCHHLPRCSSSPTCPAMGQRAWTGTGEDPATSSESQRSWRWPPSCSSQGLWLGSPPPQGCLAEPPTLGQCLWGCGEGLQRVLMPGTGVWGHGTVGCYLGTPLAQ